MLNKKGFTIIEMIAVLTIIGLLAVFIVPRMINLDSRAETQALDMGVNELNNREKFVWTQQKLSINSYNDEELDSAIKPLVDINIGNSYSWNGASLTFGSEKVTLERIPATNSRPAIWGGTSSKGNKFGWHKNPKNPHYN